MNRTITLIPDSGLQFWPVLFTTEQIKNIRCWFWEERNGEYDDGSPRYILHALQEDAETGVIKDPLTGRVPPEDQIYDVTWKAVVQSLQKQWLPLPFFALLSAEQGGDKLFRKGPGNWVRGRFAELEEGKIHLDLVFDTSLEELQEDGVYNAPTFEDSQRQDHFKFVSSLQDIAWFLNEAWVGDWLLKTQQEAQEKAEQKTFSDRQYYCWHYAVYQTFLQILQAVQQMPTIHLLDGNTEKNIQNVVEVDLVLDLGNSRSCGILIEDHLGQDLNFSSSYPLVLRDLSRPYLEYDQPFPSCIEFAKANFGNDLLSRRSGRSKAFFWPSPVRVGFEAAHLAGMRIGNEGLTGLSSPKRYIWDSRLSLQSWRYNSRSISDGGRIIDPPVNGAFMAMISPEGRVLSDEERASGENITTQPNFSRSSLFTFMFVEILMQARLQMNSPQNREQRQDKTLMRRLRSIVLTMPPGMPVAEQKILQNRTKAAIDLCWKMLGLSWNTRPQLQCRLDEATATQIVWLYNEITERLGGNVDEFMRLHGRLRPDPEQNEQMAPSIRVASLDIGGGTTDLMISSYTVPTGETICPKQEFRESFKVAGDDILEHLITNVVLPPLAEALQQAGVQDTQALLSRMIGQDWGGQSEQERHLRKLFVSTILEPIAIAVLTEYEAMTDRSIEGLTPFYVKDILGQDKENINRSASYIHRQAELAGAQNFNIADVKFAIKVQHVEASISHVMGEVISNLCEAIWAYNCDVLLVSGRPSRFRRIVDIIKAAMPVPPHRIVGMYHYRVGAYYAFRDARNRISDPKTTVVVGASLCLQAEGKLQNFVLRTRDLKMYSTARFIGRLEKNGQLRNKNVWLSNIDLEGQASEDVGFTIHDFENTTRIGFRQLGIERWPASPLYTLEFGNFPGFNKVSLPLTVKIVRQDIDLDKEQAQKDYSGREQFKIAEVTDQKGEQYPPRILSLRLQTMQNVEGYWRDTGRFTLA